MANKHISTYLNDHLAGSITALELLEFLEKTQEGTAKVHILAELRAELSVDRQELESLMDRLQISQSRTRKATAWLGEKLSELKLKLDDPSEDLHLLEALDTLSVGIEGKALLWRSLAAAAVNAPALQGLDYERLVQRAKAQRRQVEEMRVKAARAALGKGP